MRFAWLLVLVGCGRLGFDPSVLPGDAPPGDPDTGKTIRVILSIADGTSTQDVPVAGATVLVDRGTGTYDRLVTDEAGSALFPATDVVAYHVLQSREEFAAWRIYSVLVPQPGTIELGGGIPFNARNEMTLALPVDTASSTYGIAESNLCIRGTGGASSKFPIRYLPACEGRTVHLIAHATANGATRYLDVGGVTLINGATQTVSGSYLSAPLQTLQINHLPSGTTSANAVTYASTGGQLVALSSTPWTPAQASSATLTSAAPPGGDTLLVRAEGVGMGSRLTRSERLEPMSISDGTQVDASSMLPLFDSLFVTSGGHFMWSGGGTGGTLISLHWISSSFSWLAFLDPATTQATFPTFPPDLGVPTPSLTLTALLAKIDLPGATAAELIAPLDRGQDDWPLLPGVPPNTPSSITRIIHDLFTDGP